MAATATKNPLAAHLVKLVQSFPKSKWPGQHHADRAAFSSKAHLDRSKQQFASPARELIKVAALRNVFAAVTFEGKHRFRPEIHSGKSSATPRAITLTCHSS